MIGGIQKLGANNIQGEASIKEQPQRGGYNDSRKHYGE